MSFFLCGAVRRHGLLRRASPLTAAGVFLFPTLVATASPAAAIDPDGAAPPPVYRPAFDGPRGVERGRTPWRDAHAAVLREAGGAHGSHADHGNHGSHGDADSGGARPSDAPTAEPHGHGHHRPAGSGP